MKNLAVLISAAIFLLLSHTAFASHAFQFYINDNKLTLHADRVPLQNILQRFANRGITVQIDPEINPVISADINRRDLQTSLKSILKSLNYALDWQTVKEEEAVNFFLTGIQVFRHGKKTLMRPLKPGDNNLAIATDPRDGSFYVKNELLISTRDGLSLEELKKLLARYQVTIGKNGGGQGIYRIIFAQETDILALLEEISSLPGIAEAEPNYAHPVLWPSKSTSPTTLQAAVTGVKTTGSIAVAVMDSGLSGNPDLAGLTRASLDALHPDESISDTLGHGTQMAYIASGLIKPYGIDDPTGSQAPVIPIRVFDDNGFTANSLIMESIKFAQENGARVINMSWGSETKSAILEETFARAQAQGLILIASAGNEPTGRPVYPAAYSSVLGVGALDPHGKRWEDSNYGDFVTVYAPGFASLPVGYKGDPGIYAGTSIASALIAHKIAIILSENPAASMKEISAALEKSVPATPDDAVKPVP